LGTSDGAEPISISAQLLADVFDRKPRGNKDCGERRDAKNQIARQTELVKYDRAKRDRNVNRYANCAGNHHRIEPGFHNRHAASLLFWVVSRFWV
jgi:hypothetical protein